MIKNNRRIHLIICTFILIKGKIYSLIKEDSATAIYIFTTYQLRRMYGSSEYVAHNIFNRKQICAFIHFRWQIPAVLERQKNTPRHIGKNGYFDLKRIILVPGHAYGDIYLVGLNVFDKIYRKP